MCNSDWSSYVCASDLSLGMATLVGMASRREVQLVELDRLVVGSRTINNVAAPVLQRGNVGADGIIGLDSLQDMRVLIDFRSETIAVADVDEDRSERGCEIVVQIGRVSCRERECQYV